MMLRSSLCSAFRAVTLLAGLAAASFSSAHAQLQFQVQLDTTALVGHPSAPFYLDFQLNDGAGVGNANNTAILSNFDFGTGSAVGVASTFGGAMGDLASTVTLTDTEAFNEFFQSFTPGAWLRFDVSLTTTLESELTPDLFAFAILDGNLMNLPTQALGSDAFLEVNIDSLNPTLLAYAGIDPALPAPTLTTLTAVPEPSTYGLLAAMLIGGVVLARRFRGGRRLSTDLS